MSPRLPILDLQFLPSLEYFVALLSFDKVLIEACENYQKQSYRNRCYILGSNKVQYLTVPVSNGNSKVIVKDIKIDCSQKWENIHWRTITSAYGKAPFFMFYGDFIKEILFKKHKYLFDLNLELLLRLSEILRLTVDFQITTHYIQTNEESFIDLRSAIHPKKSYKLNGLYTPCRYNQIFGREFVANLSILDLLFCEGNDALRILKKSREIGHSEHEKIV